MTKLETLMVGETAKVDGYVISPGIVEFEDIFYNCLGSDDLEENVEPAMDDCYYEFHVDDENENKLFALQSAESDYYGMFTAVLKRIR